MCATIECPRVSSDAIRIRLFPYTLRNSIMEWLDTFSSHSSTSSYILSKKFMNKYFPSKKIAYLRDGIMLSLNWIQNAITKHGKGMRGYSANVHSMDYRMAPSAIFLHCTKFYKQG